MQAYNCNIKGWYSYVFIFHNRHIEEDFAFTLTATFCCVLFFVVIISGTKLVAVVDFSIKHVYYDGVNQGGSVGWHRAFVSQIKDNIQVNSMIRKYLSLISYIKTNINTFR